MAAGARAGTGATALADAGDGEVTGCRAPGAGLGEAPGYADAAGAAGAGALAWAMALAQASSRAKAAAQRKVGWVTGFMSIELYQ